MKTQDFEPPQQQRRQQQQQQQQPQRQQYYLGKKYSTEIRISSFMVSKSTNLASQSLLIFCVTSLSMNDALHSLRHGFVEGL